MDKDQTIPENYFNVLLKEAPVGIVIIKCPEMEILMANRMAVSMTYNEWIDLRGMSWYEVFPDLAKLGFDKIIKRVIESGEVFSATEMPIKITRGDNEFEFYINVTYQPVKDNAGKVTSIVATGIDMTEFVIARQRMEEELTKRVAERTRELELANADLKRFAHMASHDLREPIRKISIFNSLIKEEYGKLLPERAINFLSKIENSFQRLKTMIEGVHDYMSGDLLVTEFHQVDLNEIIDNVRHILSKPMTSKNAQLIVDELPVIEGIPALIQRLFCNLIHNGLKFTRKGVSPIIKIEYEPVIISGKEYAGITLTDNGIGFEETYSDKLFEPFTRLNPKDMYEGAGIGLAFCRKIVYWHNGSITATGKLNEGSSFHIILPFKHERE